MKLFGLVLALFLASVGGLSALVGSIDDREVRQPLRKSEDTFAIETEQFVHDFNLLLANSAFSWDSKIDGSKHSAMTSFLGRYKKALGSVDSVVGSISGMYVDRQSANKQFAASALSHNVDQCSGLHEKMIQKLNETLASFQKQQKIELDEMHDSEPALLSETKKVWNYRVKFISRFIKTTDKIFKLEQKRLNNLINTLL